MIEAPGGLHTYRHSERQQQRNIVVSSANFKVNGSLRSQLVQQKPITSRTHAAF